MPTDDGLIRQQGLTPRGWAVLIGCLGLLAFGRFVGAGIVFYFAGGLMFGLVVALPLAAMWLRPRLQFERHLASTQLPFGLTTKVSVRVTNSRRVPLVVTRISDAVPECLDPQATFDQTVVLRSGEELEFFYQIDGIQRGKHRIGPFVVETSDLFGMMTYRWQLSGHVSELTVLPQVFDLEHVQSFGGIGTQGQEASQRSTFVGELDPVSSRPWRDGDEQRSINWKATAHRNQLMVRERQPVTGDSCRVVIDNYGPAFGLVPGSSEPGESVLFEWCISAAASVIHLRARGGVPVELITVERAIVVSSAESRYAAMQILAELQPADRHVDAPASQTSTFVFSGAVDPAELGRFAPARIGRGIVFVPARTHSRTPGDRHFSTAYYDGSESIAGVWARLAHRGLT